MTKDEILRKIEELAEEGWFCEGEHHKQWYFEQILAQLISEPRLKAMKQELEDEGLAAGVGVPP